MRFTEDVLPLIGAVIAIAIVLYLTYYFSKFMGRKMGDISNKGNIKIVERVALGQDKGLAVTEIGGKYYLLGISNNGISLLMEMEDYEPPKPMQVGKDFNELFKANLLKRSAQKAGGDDEHDSEQDAEQTK